jgi:NifU-like protein involved in Fe-S cluster formation
MNRHVFEVIRDHFLNPRNQGEISDAHLVLEMGSIADGNAVKLMLKFDDSGRISQVQFQSFGDGESIAAYSILTELLVGKTAEEAALITDDDIRDWITASPKLSPLKTERAVSLLKNLARRPFGAYMDDKSTHSGGYR